MANKNKSFFRFSRFALGIFIILLSLSIFKVKSVEAALITCLDSSGNVAYVIDDIYSCPNGTSQASSYNNPQPTISQGLTNNNSSSNIQVITSGGVSQTINSNIKPETVINFDPSLAYGAFINLDPTDYKYCVLLTKDLYYGLRDSSTGNEVSALQSYLTDRGFLEYGATGYFGRATDLAVRKFQYRNEIEVTGAINEESRQIINELTCTKQMVYVDKPVSPGKAKVSTQVKSTTTSSTKTTIIPTTKAVTASTNVAPKPVTTVATTTYVSVTPASNVFNTSNNISINSNNLLSSQGGNMSLSQKNNLYFTFNSYSSRPYICISLNGADCSISGNYAPVSEGILKNYYEVIKISGEWVFTIYNGNTWGPVGSKVKIYLKENSNSSSVSVYNVNVTN